MKTLKLPVFLVAVLFIAACSTPPPPPKGFMYENVRTEKSATIVQTGTMGFFALAYGHGIAAGVVSQIDGKECGINYTQPVFIPEGKHALTFRFVVSNAGPNGPAVVYESANLELRAGESYRVTAEYRASPVPAVAFKLLTGAQPGTVVYENDVPIIR